MRKRKKKRRKKSKKSSGLKKRCRRGNLCRGKGESTAFYEMSRGGKVIYNEDTKIERREITPSSN